MPSRIFRWKTFARFVPSDCSSDTTSSFAMVSFAGWAIYMQTAGRTIFFGQFFMPLNLISIIIGGVLLNVGRSTKCQSPRTQCMMPSEAKMVLCCDSGGKLMSFCRTSHCGMENKLWLVMNPIWMRSRWMCVRWKCVRFHHLRRSFAASAISDGKTWKRHSVVGEILCVFAGCHGDVTAEQVQEGNNRRLAGWGYKVKLRL